MHDPGVVFKGLALREGDNFLDLGCGPGDYALEASVRVGDAGGVTALDKSPHLIAALKEEAEARGLRNIKAMACDILGTLPLEDGRIDVCLLSTVLHIFDLAEIGKGLFTEIRRVLRPTGRLVIIDCKKEPQPFGPPMSMRLSPDEIEHSIEPCGFMKTGFTDLGYNYMLQFAPENLQ
jgi:ubiquinone/menaquinone biosynthesis C-methylase UbiE